MSRVFRDGVPQALCVCIEQLGLLVFLEPVAMVAVAF